MKIKTVEGEFSVCKVQAFSEAPFKSAYCFTAKTAEENSLVCPTEVVPSDTLAREDGWRAFCVEGVLDFSLIGVLAEISSLLAENGIALFAVSTYNTDYIFTKREQFQSALDALAAAGYEIG